MVYLQEGFLRVYIMLLLDDYNNIRIKADGETAWETGPVVPLRLLF